MNFGMSWEKFEKIKKGGKEMAVLATHASKSRELIKVQLGNFPPNSQATLICDMFGELEYEKLMEAFCFRLPLTYVPKYLLGNTKETKQRSKSAGSTRPPGNTAMPPAKVMLRDRTVISTCGAPPSVALRKIMIVAAGMPSGEGLV